MAYLGDLGVRAEQLEPASSKRTAPLYRVRRHGIRSTPPMNRPGRLLLSREDFQIRLACDRDCSESNALIRRMYSWRGYNLSATPESAPHTDEITLQACREGTVFGTLTVRFDSGHGLAADALYRDEIDAFRSTGASVAELTRLAVDPQLGSKEVLGALFHLAYAFCGPVRGIDHVFIEVNPRHVAFYQRMLHFTAAGECKVCPRVEAPAVLMHVKVAHVGEQAALWGGQPSGASRSLYPFFCSRAEEAEALERIAAIATADHVVPPVPAILAGKTGARPESFSGSIA